MQPNLNLEIRVESRYRMLDETKDIEAPLPSATAGLLPTKAKKGGCGLVKLLLRVLDKR